MNLMFGSFSFPCNPSKLQITCENDIKTLARPHQGAISQDYGRLCRMVRGEGLFSGDNAFLHFIRLREASKSGAALLSIPGFEPFYAFFRRLDYLGAPGEDFVRYSFEFCENPSMSYTRPSAPPTHTVGAGESVYDIAQHYNISVEYILSRNPALSELRPAAGGVINL